jgi:hypothetical protein
MTSHGKFTGSSSKIPPHVLLIILVKIKESTPLLGLCMKLKAPRGKDDDKKVGVATAPIPCCTGQACPTKDRQSFSRNQFPQGLWKKNSTPGFSWVCFIEPSLANCTPIFIK